VKAAAEECDPRQHASNHDVRPELHHPRSAEAPAERQRDDEHGAERDRPHCFGRIKQRQRDEPERILREQEQEQEGNRRVFPPSWPVIKDRFGNPVKPRGWLLVPLSVGDEVVSRIKDGTITRSHDTFMTPRWRTSGVAAVTSTRLRHAAWPFPRSTAALWRTTARSPTARLEA